MSEHAWSEEQVAAYVAGGLNAADCERLEAHARECPDCMAAIERSRRLDQGLNSLFAAAKPGPDLEDRTLYALRMAPQRKPAREGWQKRLLVAASVAAVLTAGGLAGSFVDRLPTPKNLSWGFAKKQAEPVRSDEADYEAYALAGLPSNLMTDSLELQRRPTPNGEWKEGRRLWFNSETSAQGVGILPSTTGSQTTNGHVWGDTDGSYSGMVTNGTGAPHGQFMVGGSVSSDWSLRGDVNMRSNNVNGGNALNGETGYVKELKLKPPAAQPFYTPPSDGRTVATTFRPGDYKPGEQDKKQLVNYSMGLFGDIDESKRSGRVIIQGNDVTQDRVIVSKTSTVSERVPVTKTVNVMEKTGVQTVVIPAAPAPQVPEPKPAPAVANNVVIRTGDMEFEIDSFDSAAASVTKLVVAIKGAFIATKNSEKLANGKVKGTITVRVPPEQLDGLLTGLRSELGKGGELKGSRIGSQDITKQYTDLEGRLMAAREMEKRMLKIIEEGKGDIKQILEAEKELGIWRIRIEETEGELRYYKNQVALSTLTISLTEKAASVLSECKRVQTGVEVEDVEKAFQQLLAAVVDAKGRVTKSEVKQVSVGQFNATLNFDVAPDTAGALQDRLKQLGRVARLEIDFVQQPQGTITKDATVQRGDTMFLVQLYNLANIAPREVANAQVAVLDVPAAYQALKEAAAKSTGRVVVDQLNKQDQQNVSAQFDYEVRRQDEVAFRTAVDGLGEVIGRQVSRAPESENVTDAKVLHKITVIAANQIKPLERFTLGVEVADVEQTVEVFRFLALEKGRQIDSQFTRDASGKLIAKLIFELPMNAAGEVLGRFKSAGAVRVYQSTRDPQVPSGKYALARVEVTVANADRIVPADEGLWPQVRRGLSYSASVLLTSITWLVFGLCVLLPWAVIGYVGFRVVRWLFVSKQTPATPPAPSPTSVA